MAEIRIAQLDFITEARNLAQPPAKLLLDSSLIETNWGKVAQFGCATRGESFTELQLREIKIASLDRASGKDNLIGFLPKLSFDDKAVARKLALPVATQEKYFVHTSPRKGRSRRWRRVRRELRDNPLDLNINFLVLATGYSLGIGSKILDKRPLRPSFIESKGSIGSKIYGACNRKRIRVKDFSVGAIGRKTHRRAIRDKGEACTVESYLIASYAGDAFSNNRHQIMSISYDGNQSEDRQSEQVQSAYNKDSGGDEMVRGYFNLDQTEEQNEENDWSWVPQDGDPLDEENDWSWVPQDGDPLAESISSLQTTQEVLESEMQKLSELGKEFGIKDSSDENREKDLFVLPDIEGGVLEMNPKMKHLEQKLKEASNTIREKDLRLSKLQVLISSAHIPKLQKEATNIDQLEMEFERQLQEKIQAEIQCLVMVKARQSWQVRAEDQIALEEYKLSAGDDTRMMRKLRDTENKILMLKEQLDKLEVHENELFGTTEVLRIQSRTFKICLFGLVQLIMLCLSLKMFFMQASVPFGDDVPT